MKSLKDFQIIELKAMIYDASKQIALLQQDINILENELKVRDEEAKKNAVEQ